jgi:hypothetical protein
VYEDFQSNLPLGNDNSMQWHTLSIW